MLYCPYCRVSVAGDKIACPLCGGRLTGQAAPETETFPPIARARFNGSFVLRLLAFLAVMVSAVCVLTNMALGTHIWWSVFVVLGAACVWVASWVGITYRRDVTQNIGWQVALIAALSILWDRGTGWRGWSLDFVLPCVCIAGLLTMLLLAVLLHMPVRTFAGPYLSVCGIGLIPLLLIVLDCVRVPLPSLICAGLSIVQLAVLVLFHWQTFKDEFQRRFHI